MGKHLTDDVTPLKVDFWNDVLPYYTPSLFFILEFIFYFKLNGNLLLVMLLGFIINFPFKGASQYPKEFNLSRISEKLFKEDARFMGPLYAYVALDALTWLWCLCVISGVHPSFMPEWCFEDKLTSTTSGFICFTFVWGYMAGVNGLAGHELIHRKEAINKGIGMFTFSKILYSHFLLEHSSGHHRNVATPEDSATARKGEIFFKFTLRSAIGGHVNTWNREIQRLNFKYDNKCSYL